MDRQGNAVAHTTRVLPVPVSLCWGGDCGALCAPILALWEYHRGRCSHVGRIFSEFEFDLSGGLATRCRVVGIADRDALFRGPHGHSHLHVLRQELSVIRDARSVKAALTSQPWSLADPILAGLVLVLEDKRFYGHCGVDPLALGRAIWRYIIGRPNGGASTIDMQLVRTITGHRERTVRRKLSEIATSVLIRQRFDADRILACYLSIAYTGHKLAGLEAAAQDVFGQHLRRCSGREKAMLAAMLLSPIPEFRSLTWWARVIRRADHAQQRLVALGRHASLES